MWAHKKYLLKQHGGSSNIFVQERPEFNLTTIEFVFTVKSKDI